VTGSTASLVGFGALLATGVAIELAARGRGLGVTAAQAVGTAMRRTPGRVTVLLVWLWFGVHFLAR
jgi:hypothetical protein